MVRADAVRVQQAVEAERAAHVHALGALEQIEGDDRKEVPGKRRAVEAAEVAQVAAADGRPLEHLVAVLDVAEIERDEDVEAEDSIADQAKGPGTVDRAGVRVERDEVDEQVLARAPVGFRVSDERGVEQYWLMNNPLYGQLDAGAIWNRTFNEFVTRRGPKVVAVVRAPTSRPTSRLMVESTPCQCLV